MELDKILVFLESIDLRLAERCVMILCAEERGKIQTVKGDLVFYFSSIEDFYHKAVNIISS